MFILVHVDSCSREKPRDEDIDSGKLSYTMAVEPVVVVVVSCWNAESTNGLSRKNKIKGRSDGERERGKKKKGPFGCAFATTSSYK